MKAGSKFLNAVSAFALSTGVVASGASVLVLAATSVAEAAVIRSVQVHGAQRAGEEAVRSNLTIRPGVAFSNTDIDDSVKKLYATGYFSDVRIAVSGSSLVVTVKENQLINQVVFNGNRKIKDDKLQGAVQTQSQGPYDPSIVKADVERIKEAYRAIGRSDVEVTTQTAPVGPGRINLAFVINEGERTKIADISFVGNSAYSDGRLKAVIATKETGPLSFLTRKDVYSEDKLHADEESLRQFYYNHGYPDFRVISSNAVLDEASNKYTITFTVDEGQRYQYGDIAVESTSRASLVRSFRISSRPRRAMFTTPSRSRRRWTRSPSAFVRWLSVRSRHPARNRDINGHTIGISYMVDQGERAYVERIEIRGNTRTRDYVIRREFDFSEGDAFNQSMISRAKKRLEALGYFTSVNISTTQGSSPDRVVVIVNVEDQPTGSFGIGAGYAAGGDGVLLEASIEEKNFLGRGQYIRVAAGYGTDDSRTYNISFTEPYFLGYRLAAGFDLFKSSTSSNDYYKYDEQGITLRVTAPITDDLATTFRYTYKQIKYQEDGAYGDDGLPYTADDKMSAPYINMIEHGDYTQSSISQTLTYNTLDSQTLPREGIYATATQEFAGLGGDSNFYKISGRARYFKTLSTEADLIGSLSVGGGHVFATNGDKLNVFDQFTVGGKQIRGFKNDGLGPRTVDHDDPLGGTTYFTASAELSMPMPGLPEDAGLRLAAFTDAGTVFGNDVSGRGDAIEGTSMAWRASVGAGVMWASPFGNIRFDYAQPVVKESFDKVQQFRFSMANQF